MNCLTDATQENPNEGKRFSRRDGLTVQITCRGDFPAGAGLRENADPLVRPGHPDPLGR